MKNKLADDNRFYAMDGCNNSDTTNTAATSFGYVCVSAIWCSVIVVACCSATNAQMVLPSPPGLRTLDVTDINRPISPIDSAGNAVPSLHRARKRLIQADRSPMVAMLSPSTQQPDPPTIAGRPDTELRQADATRAASLRELGPTTLQATPDHRPATVEEALEVRGSVTFRKTPLSEVVFLLSDLWHINIVAGDAVTGEVSGSFHDAPLREVLSAVLTSSGYSYRKTGSSLVVLTADQVGTDNPDFVSETMTIPTALRVDNSAVEAAQMLLSDRGQIRRLGSDLVLVIDSQARVERVRHLYASFGPTPSQAAAMTASELNSSLSNQFRSETERGERLRFAESVKVPQAGIAYFSPQFTEAEDMQEPLQKGKRDRHKLALPIRDLSGSFSSIKAKKGKKGQAQTTLADPGFVR